MFQSLLLLFQNNGQWEAVEFLHNQWDIENFVEIIDEAMEYDDGTYHDYIWIIGSCMDWIYHEIDLSIEEWRDLLLDLVENGYEGVSIGYMNDLAEEDLLYNSESEDESVI